MSSSLKLLKLLVRISSGEGDGNFGEENQVVGNFTLFVNNYLPSLRVYINKYMFLDIFDLKYLATLWVKT